MSINISIVPLPGKSLNPNEVRSLMGQLRVPTGAGGYVFPNQDIAASGNGITIGVSPSAITLSGGNDSGELRKFKPIFEKLTTISNFGKTMPPDAGRLLRQ